MNSSISNRVERNFHRGVFKDRVFVRKLTTMLFLIIGLSLSIIYYESISRKVKNSAMYYQKLSSLEKSFSGKNIVTDVNENDFSGLEDLDLSDIEILDSQDLIHKSIVKNSFISTKKKINITSGAIKNKARKRIFITSQDMSSLSFIKKRFYATNNISFALTIAKRFLEKKSYKKALKWALIANEIDGSDERSWIIFAKVKLALKEKDDAISALKSYLKEHHATNVKKFLDDIEKS